MKADEIGYPLDRHTPVRHVVTELDRVAPDSLSVAEMAATYNHPNPADLGRVVKMEGRRGKDDAKVWLLTKVIGELGETQVAPTGDGRYVLAKPFDKLRYKRHKIHRMVDTDDADAEATLRVAYNNLKFTDRPFYVTLVGARGKESEERLSLHPLAHAFPHMSQEEFWRLAKDMKANGVQVPITLRDGKVLDGRHRVALAAALKVPVRATEFVGDDAEALKYVLSLNVERRHLSIAQRGLVVQEFYLPQAEAEAEERKRQAGEDNGRGQDRFVHSCTNLSDPVRATKVAADRSNGLATPRTLATMQPVREAPKTKARIMLGEIKTASEARREALKEIGSDEPEKPPIMNQKTANEKFGSALHEVKLACLALESGTLGDTTRENLHERISELEEHLRKARALLG